MTGQIADVYEYNGNRYNIVAIKGTMNFDIHELGFDPVPIHTACWRGYHCIYNITEEGLFLKDLFVNDKNGSYPPVNGVEPEDDRFDGKVYHGINIPVKFDGGIIIGNDFLTRYYIHMGFQRVYAYKTVYELIFKEGLITKKTDLSKRAALIRTEIDEKGIDRANISKFVEESFSLDYEDKWTVY